MKIAKLHIHSELGDIHFDTGTVLLVTFPGLHHADYSWYLLGVADQTN